MPPRPTSPHLTPSGPRGPRRDLGPRGARHGPGARAAGRRAPRARPRAPAFRPGERAFARRQDGHALLAMRSACRRADTTKKSMSPSLKTRPVTASAATSSGSSAAGNGYVAAIWSRTRASMARPAGRWRQRPPAPVRALLRLVEARTEARRAHGREARLAALEVAMRQVAAPRAPRAAAESRPTRSRRPARHAHRRRRRRRRPPRRRSEPPDQPGKLFAASRPAAASRRRSPEAIPRRPRPLARILAPRPSPRRPGRR